MMPTILRTMPNETPYRAVTVWKKQITAVYGSAHLPRQNRDISTVSGRVSSQQKQDREIPLCRAGL